jgi:site-specific DNA-methyltransferase (adenine-specific)
MRCRSNINDALSARMPETMAEDHILAWSKVNDLVLDIFAGSGTTLKMAALNQRKFLGFDLSAKYVRLAKRRLKATLED